MKTISVFGIIVIGLFSISCKKDNPTSSESDSIVEGTVAYTNGGGTWEIYYPGGFYLKNLQWIRGFGNTKMMFYVNTMIDSTHLNKRVRVEGEIFEHKPKVDNSTVDYSSYYFMQVKKISIVNK